MMCIAIAQTRDRGTDYCLSSIRSASRVSSRMTSLPSSITQEQLWDDIQALARVGWHIFPGRTIEISEEMNRAFTDRLEEYWSSGPCRTRPEIIANSGGFTVTYGQYMIVFRYNLRINDIEEMY